MNGDGPIASLDLQMLGALASALAIGLLIGVERERNPAAQAGLRTFALVGLLGGLAAIVARELDAGWIVAAGAGAVAAMIIVANARAPATDDPGTTTVVALLVAYLLGALAVLGDRRVAIMLGIATTALLYFKPELTGALARLSRRDLLSVLQFTAVTFVVLPFLPNEGFGPYGALNPHRIWLMVVLVSGIGLAGYIALKLVGGERGALLVGVFGGLVSSTATTLAYAPLGRADATRSLAARVIVVANVVMLMRIGVLAAVASLAFLSRLAPVLAGAVATGLLVAFGPWRRPSATAGPVPEIANPTDLREAIGFGVLFAAVLLLSAWLTERYGASGLYVVAVASGLTDVDAITLSTGALVAAGKVSAADGALAVVLAIAANQAVKVGFVAARGGPALLRSAGAPLALIAGAAVLIAVALRFA